jgi:FlaA1/EpsC-like NDP-sugar epimerase
VAYRNECDLYPADEDPELYYRKILLPKKIESDLSYFKKANVFRDIIWIFKGLWVSLAGIIHWHQIWERHSKILVSDILLIQVSWFLVHLLRFSSWPVGNGFEYYNIGFGLLPPAILIGLFLGGCYRTPIKHFSLNDALRLAVTLFFIWMLIFMSILYFQRGISLLFGPLYWFILTTLLILSRGYWRIKGERNQGLFASSQPKVLIYGSGVGGAALSSWIGNNATGLKMIGFLDDSIKLRGMRIKGHRVLGRESDIPSINQVYKVDEIWATFLPDPVKRARLQSLCEKLQIKIYWLADIEPFSRVQNNLSPQTLRKQRKRRIKTYVKQPAYYSQISPSKSMGSFEKTKQVLTNIS